MKLQLGNRAIKHKVHKEEKHKEHKGKFGSLKIPACHHAGLRDSRQGSLLIDH